MRLLWKILLAAVALGSVWIGGRHLKVAMAAQEPLKLDPTRCETLRVPDGGYVEVAGSIDPKQAKLVFHEKTGRLIRRGGGLQSWTQAIVRVDMQAPTAGCTVTLQRSEHLDELVQTPPTDPVHEPLKRTLLELIGPAGTIFRGRIAWSDRSHDWLRPGPPNPHPYVYVEVGAPPPSLLYGGAIIAVNLIWLVLVLAVLRGAPLPADAPAAAHVGTTLIALIAVAAVLLNKNTFLYEQDPLSLSGFSWYGAAAIEVAACALMTIGLYPRVIDGRLRRKKSA